MEGGREGGRDGRRKRRREGKGGWVEGEEGEGGMYGGMEGVAAAMQGASVPTGSNLGFSVFAPKDTWTCGPAKAGFKPPTH